jgi:hypothetical protein
LLILPLDVSRKLSTEQIRRAWQTACWLRESLGSALAQSSSDTETILMISRKCSWGSKTDGGLIYVLFEVSWYFIFTWNINNWGFGCQLSIQKTIRLQTCLLRFM